MATVDKEIRCVELMSVAYYRNRDATKEEEGTEEEDMKIEEGMRIEGKKS